MSTYKLHVTQCRSVRECSLGIRAESTQRLHEGTSLTFLIAQSKRGHPPFIQLRVLTFQLAEEIT